MNHLWWQTFGNGDYHLVLLHGWGVNSQVWNCITVKLASHFTLHLVDLPGFGRSHELGIMELDKMAKCIIQQAPTKAIWLGWSFGALVASQIALTYPNYVLGLITVASSPCFIEQKTWPGIKYDIINEFQCQLNKNLQCTLQRFLALQTMGTNTAQQDARILKKAAFSLPTFKMEVLNASLEILKTTDLRKKLVGLIQPHLRIYGSLDWLIPQKIVALLDSKWIHSKSKIITEAAHTPFISHPDEFCQLVVNFSYQI